MGRTSKYATFSEINMKKHIATSLFFLFGNKMFFPLQKCVKDSLSPIKIRLNFSQPESHEDTATLDVASLKQDNVLVCSAAKAVIPMYTLICLLIIIENNHIIK